MSDRRRAAPMSDRTNAERQRRRRYRERNQITGVAQIEYSDAVVDWLVENGRLTEETCDNPDYVGQVVSQMLAESAALALKDK